MIAEPAAAPTANLLTCPRHGQVAEGEWRWACPVCGSTLRVGPDLASVTVSADTGRRPRGMFRFPELLPINGEPRTGQHTGWTPLLRAGRLGAELGIGNLYLKLDCYNGPSYSYTDRVVASAVQRAAELGAKAVACVSTGNVGNSVAALAARAGKRAVVFCPASIEPAKNAMSLALGATVIQVDGTFDEVNAQCKRLTGGTDALFVNLDLRAYYAEGAKTVAFEIVEQLDWAQPDHVVAPAAGAILLTRMAYGFEEMAALGLTGQARVPRVHAAQAAGCAPIAAAYVAGERVPRPCVPDTIAHSIAIGNPGDGGAALDVLARTGGTAQAVTDDEIVLGAQLLATSEGVFTEPAGGAAVAATARLAAQGRFGPQDTVVVVISGSGLKTQTAEAVPTEHLVRVAVDDGAVSTAFHDAVHGRS